MIPTFVDNTPPGCNPAVYSTHMRELMEPLDVVYVLTDKAPRAMIGLSPASKAVLDLLSELAMFASLEEVKNVRSV
jgi:hypothetical protein